MSTPSRRSFLAAAAGTSAGALLAACGSASSAASSTAAGTSASSAGSAASASGTIQVLYAGSLVHLMEKQVIPAFKKSSGVAVKTVSGGSNALAKQISGKVRKADVFVSASPKADEQIMGSANGDWVSWYAQFATSQLVLGYNKSSKFASQITSKKWQEVLSLDGIKVGTTDRKTDPKGKLAYQALTSQGSTYPALAKLAEDATIVHGEEAMVGQLQAGQLDVGFFYASEAKASGIPTVPLTGTKLAAKYTVTIPKGSENPTAGAAFIAYLLGPEGTKILRSDGFTVSARKVTGSGVPSELKSILKAS